MHLHRTMKNNVVAQLLKWPTNMFAAIICPTNLIPIVTAALKPKDRLIQRSLVVAKLSAKMLTLKMAAAHRLPSNPMPIILAAPSLVIIPRIFAVFSLTAQAKILAPAVTFVQILMVAIQI